ncbi:flagellin N-terminal helical domain-containing protein [Segnochrobactrum spirostomi]|uniref:Flagellin n=1 Tax=Segnochrobactrum spirostomi TaxID=2608987 RepID=A0A6A7Y233_9HYPH|nr:flagellin [Segnochrobactrum spirostomi]MQT12775.1 flagellin [Segnochrobactrum spirostomi]
MTSLNTNNSATIALATLRTINSQLDTTNTRVSTGKRINSAADGAAYWSISTTLDSDNGALGAVKDAIGLDKNTVDAASSGLTSVLSNLNTLKDKLTTATSTSADRAKLQQEISSTLSTIKTTADATVMNGANWLSTNTTTDPNTTKLVMASFSRTTAGGSSTVSVNSTQVDTTGFMLYNASTAATAAVSGTAKVATAATVANPTTDQGQFAIGFTVAVSTDAAAHKGGFLDTTYSFAAGTYTPPAGTTPGSYTAPGTAAPADDFSIGTMDISKLTNSATDLAKVQAYLKVVDATIQQLTAGATTLGSTSTRLKSQQDFAQTLIETNTSSIGALVDSDMESESTKLKALQTQQQIGIQSLSIANSSTQNLLSLFR